VPTTLKNILAGLDDGFSTAIKNCQLLAVWEKVVDEGIKRNTEPVKIRNRTLFIQAASPAWANELTYLKREIIKRFNQQAGSEAISDIRFKAREVS
jgi:predicted nucleic acid-binding Zn ribbon protein